MTEAPQQNRYRVDGMDCASCARKIDTAVRRLPGVEDVSVSVTTGTMTVRHGGDETLVSRIRDQVVALGYEATPIPAAGRRSPSSADATHDHHHGSCSGHDHAGDGHHHHHGDTHSHDPDHDHDGQHHHGRDEEGHDHGHSRHDHGAEAAAGLHGHDHGPMTGPWWRSKKGRLTIAAGAALALAYAIGRLVPATEPWIFTLAMLVGLGPVAWRAVMAARFGTPFSIEMLMTIAAIGAVLIGATEEAAMVVFLFLIGELLEGVAAGRARSSIQSLAALVPKTALVEENGATREMPAETLAVGSVVLVRPGERIPADGIVLSGESAVDEAPVSGESIPVRKAPDSTVFAGTVNGEAALRVRVTAGAADNTIARVVRLVEEAQESKAPTERFIDRFSRYYTPGVVIVAALVAIIPPLFGGAWNEWIYKGLAILLIGCPCALVISTPAAIAASLSAGAKRGLLLKGGAVLEELGRLTAIAFDKTGTLTEGRPQVTDIVPFERGEAEVLRLAAALETGSSHPLARAVLARAAADGIAAPPVDDANAVGGKGVAGTVDGKAVFFGSPKAVAQQAPLADAQSRRIAALNDEGKTVSLVLVEGVIAGAVAMRDEPRPDAARALKALAGRGVRTIMLTGDNRRTAEAIGRDLGIEVRAELMPADKQRIVGELKSQGLIVGKVGDGINDAPALAAADVGIAMGGGTDVALETADAAALHGRVTDIPAMMELSRGTMANIRQNIGISLGLKAFFLVTTIIGITGLWPAILADTGATVLVTLNALRLLRPSAQVSA